MKINVVLHTSMFIFFLPFLLSCQPLATNSSTPSVIPPADSVIIIRHLGKDPLMLYFESPVMEHDPPFTLSAQKPEKRIFSTTPFLLYEANREQTPYLLFPGDTVSMRKNKETSILTTTQSTTRNREHAFFQKMIQAIGPLRGPDAPETIPLQSDEYRKRDSISFKKFGKRLPSAAASVAIRDSLLWHLYQQRLGLLQQETQQLSPAFTAYLQQFLLYQYLANSFNVLPYKNGNTAAMPANLSACLRQQEPYLFNDSLLHIETYRQFLYAYNLFLTGDTGTTAPLISMQSAITHFKGSSKDYLLYAITKLQLNRNPNAALLPDILTLFRKECTTPDYLQRINTTTQWLTQQKDAPDDALTDAGGQTLSWKAMTERFKGKTVYIDFWASWCMPCLEEMPNSLKLQQAIADSNIAFIYVSMDKSKTAWLRSMADHKGLMTSRNSFLLMRNFEATLAKQLRLKTIPRYLLLDANGRIINPDAPRPGDPQLPALLSKTHR